MQDMASLAQLKKKIEAELEKVRDQAQLLIFREFQKVCDRKGWNVSTADIFNVWKRTPGVRPLPHEWEAVENTTTERLFELVTWYEDEFGSFPQVKYDDGKWYPEGLGEMVNPNKNR